MKTILSMMLATMPLLCGAGAAFAEPLNDLSPFQTVKLDVNLRSVDIGEKNAGVYFDVPNNYSNSIICSIDVSVPVTKNGIEGVFEVSQANVLIFPTKGFDYPISYQLNTSQLASNEVVPLGLNQRVVKAATCTGWTLGKRLPRRTCQTLNPNHDQFCVNIRAAGRDYYPVVQGKDAHLGDCGC